MAGHDTRYTEGYKINRGSFSPGRMRTLEIPTSATEEQQSQLTFVTQLSCARPRVKGTTHIISFNSHNRCEVNTIISPVQHRRRLRLREAVNLLKVIQLLGFGIGIRTQAVWLFYQHSCWGSVFHNKLVTPLYSFDKCLLSLYYVQSIFVVSMAGSSPPITYFWAG